jgi:hypothetical protein
MPSNLSIRITTLQKAIGVPQTGVFDKATCIELLSRGNKTANTTDLITLIKMVQRIVNTDDDGVPGSETMTRIEAFISPALPKPPVGASMIVSRRSIEALIAFEITSQEVYEKRYQFPIWPKGQSGVTIGIGYDLGFATTSQITQAWGQRVSPFNLQLLLSVKGKTGLNAKDVLPTVKSVKIPFEDAIEVFHLITLPEFAGRTKRLYPGVQKLPPDAQGALISLVYNRGTATKGDRRREMKNIISLVAGQDVDGIAAELRSMKRLWNPDTEGGLIKRREKEAQLVENASFNILPEDQIII